MYYVQGQPVFDAIDRFASDDARDGFYVLVAELAERGPHPSDQPELAIQAFHEPSKPNCYTAPFPGGLLIYQVMRDQPIIRLVDVFLP